MKIFVAALLYLVGIAAGGVMTVGTVLFVAGSLRPGHTLGVECAIVLLVSIVSMSMAQAFAR